MRTMRNTLSDNIDSHVQDTVGVVDAIRLDAVQLALLGLYGVPPGLSTQEADAAAVYCSKRRVAVRDALGAACEHLLVDLNNHVKLLGEHICHFC